MTAHGRVGASDAFQSETCGTVLKKSTFYINKFKVLWKMSADGNTDQRSFNDTNEDLILFK